MEIEYWGIVVDGVNLLAMVVVAFLIYKLTRKILKRIDTNVIKLLPKQDTMDIVVMAPIATVGVTAATPKVTVEDKSRAATQKRLDEDTKRVGYVRGEIYQLEDGSWGIHWGGKYPI